MSTAAVLFADGFEEIEAITQVDILRRAGIEVYTAGVTGKEVVGGHEIRIDTDLTADELPSDLDVLVIPGGSRGAENIAASPEAMGLVRRQLQSGKLVAAICAAPAVVLGDLIGERRFTCYPGFEDRVKVGTFTTDRVVKDGNLITSRAPGTAAEFALAIVREIVGEKAATDLAAKTIQPGA